MKANLNIKNVNPTHAGIYICIADSITKRVTTTFNVIVTKKGTEKTEGTHYCPILEIFQSSLFVIGNVQYCYNLNIIRFLNFTDKTSEVNANLRIYEWTEEIQQEEGQTMYAVCRATQGLTQPMPNIRWTIGDKDIKESDNIMVCYPLINFGYRVRYFQGNPTSNLWKTTCKIANLTLLVSL